MPVEKEIRFILKDTRASKKSPVYLKYTCHDGVMKYSTGQRVCTREIKRVDFFIGMTKFNGQKIRKPTRPLTGKLQTLHHPQ
jgi:hypothetical protein